MGIRLGKQTVTPVEQTSRKIDVQPNSSSHAGTRAPGTAHPSTRKLEASKFSDASSLPPRKDSIRIAREKRGLNQDPAER